MSRAPETNVNKSFEHIAQFLSIHAQLLDERNFDAWLDGFHENARYRVISAENLLLGLDMPLLLANNKNMLRDRIVSLREANVYNLHYDHHLLGLPVIKRLGDVVQVVTPITIHQIDQNGIAELYCIGRYKDELICDSEAIAIMRRDVIYENFGVLRLLSTPL
jgi:anthranilate 1,2-dioxygenase small subunit